MPRKQKYRPYKPPVTVEQVTHKRLKALQYRRRHPERVKEWHLNWYLANKEAICARRRRHYRYNKATEALRPMYLLAEACREAWEQEFKWKRWGSGKVRIVNNYFRKNPTSGEDTKCGAKAATKCGKKKKGENQERDTADQKNNGKKAECPLASGANVIVTRARGKSVKVSTTLIEGSNFRRRSKRIIEKYYEESVSVKKN